ncbi:cytochrome p450 [Lasallia pustulata]|uniref:Cytochrome p450 n=1 Tax=Lasallia pustulata TaxID=136370 RepID=A0A1W5CTX2_9LECA|nr:cytochrome p450 [Lasallia pustulata]
MAKLPLDCHPHYLPGQVMRAMPELGPIFYFDAWPMADPMLFVASAAGAYQITQEYSLPKFRVMRDFIDPLAGEYNLVTMEGDMWKRWRSIFNPGFSSSHLMTLIPDILEDTLTFCGILRQHVQKDDMFSLEELTISLTVDVIGRVTLDTRFNQQRSKHDMMEALRSQVRWLPARTILNPLSPVTVLRPLVYWYNTRRMNDFISRELDTRLATHQNGHVVDKAKRSKSVIDLALQRYMAEKPADKAIKGMDAIFKTVAMCQIKLFVFAGHDTTASTICWLYHLLSKNPPALSRLRAEHDSIFGTDLAQTASLIASNPHLLNQLPYTLAVIKETLRLYPPASSTRNGEPGFSFTDPSGRHFPTHGFLVWSVHQATHREPSQWPQPDTFLPERWLVAPGDPLYPIKGAWRPFEFGPRNCIGQELALLEVRIVLALTVREFDVRAAYEEWDRLNPGKGGRVNGERAYQVLMGSAHPQGGFPCRIKMAER